MCLFSLLFFVFWLWFCCLLRVFGCCVFLFSPWNHIISVHHEPEAYYSIGFYCRIHTASKYLHNDLARAIKALEQKKSQRITRSCKHQTTKQDLAKVSSKTIHLAAPKPRIPPARIPEIALRSPPGMGHLRNEMQPCNELKRTHR